MPVQRTEAFSYSMISFLSEDSEDSIVGDIDTEISDNRETPCEERSPAEERRRKRHSMTDCESSETSSHCEQRCLGSHSGTDQLSTMAEYALSESDDSVDGMPSTKRRKVLKELCTGVRTTFE